jgi:exonuclease III
MKLFKLKVTRMSGGTDISGGGVSLYIRENIPFKIRIDLQHRSIKCLWITIRPKWLPRNISRITIATVYLPSSLSSTDMDEFNNYFCFCIDIDSLVSESTETAIVATGDFNPNSNNFMVKRFE